MKIEMVLAFFVLLSMSGCGSDSTAATELTLDNCTTSVASNVPEFYSKYFKCVNISISGSNIVIESDGLPPHKSAYYGTGHVNYTTFDTAGSRNQNPNTISSQTIHLEFPEEPVSSGHTIDTITVDQTLDASTDYTMGTAGVGLDGVALYNSLAAAPDNIDEEYFTFDSYDAHPDGGGDYHYHSATPGPLEVLQKLGLVTTTTPGSAEIELFGIMCDGTVVLGCKELNGNDISDAVDSQNGHEHDITDAAAVSLTLRYHVHVCPDTYTTHKYNPEVQYYNSCTSS